MTETSLSTRAHNSLLNEVNIPWSERDELDELGLIVVASKDGLIDKKRLLEIPNIGPRTADEILDIASRFGIFPSNPLTQKIAEMLSQWELDSLSVSATQSDYNEFAFRLVETVKSWKDETAIDPDQSAWRSINSQKR